MSDMWVPGAGDSNAAAEQAASKAWSNTPVEEGGGKSHYVDPYPSYNEGVLVPGSQFTINPATGAIVPTTSAKTDTTKAAPANPNAADSGTAKNLLRQYGLDELTPYVDDWIRQGLTLGQITALLYDRSSDVGKIVDRIYPEIRLRQEAGKDPITVDQIRSTRTAYKNLATTYGLPADYITPERVQKWIVNDVDPKEQENKIIDGIVQVRQAPAETRQALADWGLSEGAMALMILDDTNEPLDAIQRHVAAAQIAGTSQRVGYGALTQTEAERAASLGLTTAQAASGLSQLASSQELFRPLDQGETAISRQTQLAAGLEQNAAAGQEIQNRAARRKALFGDGGGTAQGRGSSLAGLSSAQA